MSTTGPVRLQYSLQRCGEPHAFPDRRSLGAERALRVERAQACEGPSGIMEPASRAPAVNDLLTIAA